MGDEDSEDGVPYDDDFEEEIPSEDEEQRSKSNLGNVSAVPEEVEPPRPMSQASQHREMNSEVSLPALPPRTGSAASNIGGSTPGVTRVVRGKVSVGEGDRPPSGGDIIGANQGSSPIQNASPSTMGGSSGHNAVSSSASASAPSNGKPVWLQSGAGGGGGASQQDRPQSGIRKSRHGRPPLEPDPFMAMLEAPRPSARSGAPASSRRMPSQESSAVGADDFGGRHDGDDRKVKRLEQEIQRLRQRLSETDLFSAQDDMLPKFQLEEVKIGVQIAQGGFSSVHHAVWRSTPCALKKIFDPVITEELKQDFENEVKMLRLLRHPHIITLMAVCRVPPALSVLTEFVAGGSIFELLHSPPRHNARNRIDPTPEAVFPTIYQAAGALAYMHSMLIAHRDIKSQNVLLTEGSKPIAKLCDFGLARMKSELCTGTMQWAGTPCYMAPELFAKKRYTEAVDVFAFGTMIWEVASTEIPHANLDPGDIAHKVSSKDGAGLPVVHSWPPSLKNALKATLAVEAEHRPSMAEVTKMVGKIVSEFPLQD